MNILVTKLRDLLQEMFTPKVTVYQWSNMNEGQKDKFRKEYKTMKKVFREMEDTMDKFWEGIK